MKIRCVTTVDHRDHDHDPFLTTGRTYVVLTLSFGRDHGITVRVQTDDGEGAIGIYPMALFHLVDGHVSSRWSARAYSDGSLQFGPADWLAENFWDDEAETSANLAVSQGGFDEREPGARTRRILAEIHSLEAEG